MPSENNKRIAKNTLFLYIRMLLIMGVSLYTVRIVLNTLGVVDFGIYNVVGGIVTMFAFLSNTMSGASQRFFAFEIGQKNFVKLKQTFSLTISIYAIIAVAVLILAETIGLWFLNTQMTIPADRMEAANWVYQFSIASFLVTIMAIPYNAAMIAHENMKAYAYISIIEVVLKLVIVYLLVLFSMDKLKLYAVLTLATTLIVRMIYTNICKRKYEECRFSFYWERELFRTLIGYSGWNIIGSFSAILKDQGINLLLNVFFNPAINAARGIAFQLNYALLQFTNSFYTAVKPQITKTYAANDILGMQKLVFRSAKFGFFLLLLLTTPLLIETEFILKIWLNEIPPYVIIFTRLIIINLLIDALNIPIVSAIQATGNIKKYQLSVSIILLLNLPISYLLLKLGFSPTSTFISSILISIACYVPRLIIFQKTTSVQYRSFIKKVLIVCFFVTVISYITPFIIYSNMNTGIFRFSTIIASEIILFLPIVYFIGLSKDEREFVIYFIKKKKNELS